MAYNLAGSVLLSQMTERQHELQATPSMPVDTTRKAETVQIELLRKASLADRFARACSLTATAISLSRRAIARANPDLSPQEVDLKFVELHYGKPLAARLRSYLNDRSD